MATLSSFENGDSYLVENILPETISDIGFTAVRDEVSWHEMFHRGGPVPRLIAIQATIETDGSVPLYRLPSLCLLC